MKMIKHINQTTVYVYECEKCGQRFTELVDKGTLFCGCDIEENSFGASKSECKSIKER